MSQDLFGKIFSSALTEDATFPVDAHARWITRANEYDARLMAESEVQVLRLGQREVAATLNFEGRKFFCLCGYERPEEVAGGLKEIDASPGLFATFVTQANIPSVATAAQARDVLQDNHGEVADYKGHDLDAVVKIFPMVHFWEVEAPGAVSFTNDIYRLSGSFVTRSYGGYPLEMSKATKQKIIEIFEGGLDFLPFPLILQGVLSYSWQSIFLDFYRSIEQLYSAPRLRGLAGRFEFGCTLSELAEALESFLAWRPKEEEALSHLLRETSDPVRVALVEAMFDGAGAKPTPSAEKCAALIYKLRNSHVHFRPAMRPNHRTPAQWDSIISAMCDVVGEVYQHFGSEFLIPNSARA
ncbi:hypothetical protein [Cereibacter johrii]|uniref:hypothetical protein n=1 Tax=Cereibacter johrii TaxID=445629 RepID=UPI003CF7F0D3